jgi:hypothetical protein
LELFAQRENEVFRVFGGDLLLKSREEAITVFGDRAEHTRLITLS